MTREEAIQVLSRRPMIAPSKSNKQKMFEEAIDMAIEALSADRPHGVWIDVNGDGTAFKCDQCGAIACCDDNYCGNCGARMKGGDDK